MKKSLFKYLIRKIKKNLAGFITISCDGLISAAAKHGFDLRVTGVPSLFYLRLADDPTLQLHQAWVAECVKRGVYFTNHHNHFINAALSEDDIRTTIEIADEAFSVVARRI